MGDRGEGAPDKTASPQEAQAGAAFSAINPPTEQPLDYPSAEGPLMGVGSGAAPELAASVEVDHAEPLLLHFHACHGVTDRSVQSTMRVAGYFEIRVESCSTDVAMAVGFATKPYPPFRFPGWERHSVAYHSDNGHCFFDDNGDGRPYGRTWGAGDVVGCGWHNRSGENEFFFTLNGDRLGTACLTSVLGEENFATFGCDGPAKVRFNFLGPFVYADPPLMVSARLHMPTLSRPVSIHHDSTRDGNFSQEGMPNPGPPTYPSPHTNPTTNSNPDEAYAAPGAYPSPNSH